MSAHGADLTSSGGGAFEYLDHVLFRTIRDPRSEMIPLDEVNVSAERCRQLALDARLIDQAEALGRAWREVERHVDVRRVGLRLSRDRSEQVDGSNVLLSK